MKKSCFDLRTCCWNFFQRKRECMQNSWDSLFSWVYLVSGHALLLVSEHPSRDLVPPWNPKSLIDSKGRHHKETLPIGCFFHPFSDGGLWAAKDTDGKTCNRKYHWSRTFSCIQLLCPTHCQGKKDGKIWKTEDFAAREGSSWAIVKQL